MSHDTIGGSLPHFGVHGASALFVRQTIRKREERRGGGTETQRARKTTKKHREIKTEENRERNIDGTMRRRGKELEREREIGERQREIIRDGLVSAGEISLRRSSRIRVFWRLWRVDNSCIYGCDLRRNRSDLVVSRDRKLATGEESLCIILFVFLHYWRLSFAITTYEPQAICNCAKVQRNAARDGIRCNRHSTRSNILFSNISEAYFFMQYYFYVVWILLYIYKGIKRIGESCACVAKCPYEYI